MATDNAVVVTPGMAAVSAAKDLTTAFVAVLMT